MTMIKWEHTTTEAQSTDGNPAEHRAAVDYNMTLYASAKGDKWYSYVLIDGEHDIVSEALFDTAEGAKNCAEQLMREYLMGLIDKLGTGQPRFVQITNGDGYLTGLSEQGFVYLYIDSKGEWEEVRTRHHRLEAEKEAIRMLASEEKEVMS